MYAFLSLPRRVSNNGFQTKQGYHLAEDVLSVIATPVSDMPRNLQEEQVCTLKLAKEDIE